MHLHFLLHYMYSILHETMKFNLSFSSHTFHGFFHDISEKKKLIQISKNAIKKYILTKKVSTLKKPIKLYINILMFTSLKYVCG